MGFEDCWARVVSATDLKTKSALAKFLNIATSSVNGARVRDTFPPKWAVKIAGEYNLSTDWILTGQGAADSVEDGEAGYEDNRSSKFIFVPRYNVKVSAGHGALIHSEQVVNYLAFEREWILKKGLAADQLVLIEVAGDSMVPTLLEGDLILVNLGVQKFRGDALYVLNFDGELQVKRIQRQPNGDVIIQSDNPAYKPFTAVGDQLEMLTIVGRVVWFGRDI